MGYLISGAATFLSTLILTPVVKFFSHKWGVLDYPDNQRKLHTKPTPLLGGLAIFAAILIGIIVAINLKLLPGLYVKDKFILGIIVALFILVIGGMIDDAWKLPAKIQIIFPLLAIVAVMVSGIGVTSVTNPFGGLLYLNRFAVTVINWNGITYKIPILASLFTVAWLLGTTYTTKLLDGLDGLVSGITVIGALILAAVSLRPDVMQNDSALLALIVAAAFLGFLIFNFHPASIFLGEGGSTMPGFILGVLAIIAGGKIATTLLILGLPLFDMVYVAIKRYFKGGKKAVVEAGREHLHFRLLERGFAKRSIVIFFYLVALGFGASTLILVGWQKVIAIAAIVVLLAFLAIESSWHSQIFKHRKKIFVVIIVAVAIKLVIFGTGFFTASERGQVVLPNQVSVKVDVVRSEVERERGLSGRLGLAPNTGMLFVFSTPDVYSFWMKGMRFPIDIIWLKNGMIVDIAERVPIATPNELPVYTPLSAADRVLEVESGFVTRNQLKKGDKLQILTQF